MKCFSRIYPYNDSRHLTTCDRFKKRNIQYTSDYLSWDHTDVKIIAYNVESKHHKFLKHLNFKTIVL